MGGPLRIGVIGCGAIATSVHLRVLQRLPNVRVTALADPAPASLERGSEVSEHDSASVQLALTGGGSASCFFSFRAARADSVELVGTRGALHLDRYARSLTLRGVRARTFTREIIAWRARAIIRPRTEPSWSKLLLAFVHAIRGHSARLPTFDDGLRSLEVVVAAERAAGVG